MTDKADHAPALHRLQNLYSALIACDHAIIRSTHRADLFDAICSNVVKLSHVRVAWIGTVDIGSQRVWPQAHAGEGWNYFEWAKLIADIDQLPNQGPAGVAIHETRAIWSHDLLHDPDTAGMRELAQAQGWRAAAVLPLTAGGRTIGALSLYADAGNAFETRERDLLLQLASNISYALDVFELDAQRREAEYALQESEVRYSALFASNCMPMLVVDPSDGRIVDANIRAVSFYGWDLDTFKSMNVMDVNVLSPDQIRQEMAHAVNANKSYFDFQHRLASGEVRNVEVFSSPISFSGQTYLISAIHDVTERRRLESQVHSGHTLTQRFIDQLPGTAFVKDSQLRLLMVNRHLGKQLGMEPKDLIGKTAHDIFPKEFADLVTDLDRMMLEQGGSRTFEEVFNGRHSDTNLFVIDNGTGQPMLGGFSVDVTERYRSAARSNALLQVNELGSRLPEKEFLKAGLELAEKVTYSKIGFLHFVNDDQQTLELVTWTSGALQGCTAVSDSHYPVDHAGIWADALRTQQPMVCNDYTSYPGRRGLPQGHAGLDRVVSVPIMEHGLVRMILGVGNKDGAYDDFDVFSLLLFGNDIWRIVQRARAEAALQQRVDELVVLNHKLSQTQLQLLQSEKMASVGQLASGVAHEINNPIGFVKSNLSTLATYVDNLLHIVQAYEQVEGELGASAAAAFEAVHRRKQELDYDYLANDLAQLIEESRDGVQRVSKIVLDLKNFSRSGDGAKEWADLHSGIESTINVVWNQLKYKVEVVREYGELPLVHCVASQINQVVMNLLTNAEQAISGRGHITIRTGCDGDQVWFEVQDDGSGITPANQARIFEPFYTSKPVGQGTGLGLSIAFGIVQRHQGHITVQSTPGQGSTFRVTLPVDAPTPELQPQE